MYPSENKDHYYFITIIIRIHVLKGIAKSVDSDQTAAEENYIQNLRTFTAMNNFEES